MCILCVVQKWSRRVATMLPWLVIPLIGLWALSQLLPPGFRFEITSPRLACVLVLLVTLFWYEILMPQLSAWRVRRSARLREKKRFEAMEMQKIRKTATRRCRNCLTPYRDQNPGGGRFMCLYCGHISKRPVLDIPGSAGTASGIIGDLVGKGGKIWNGKVWSENGWICGQDWLENRNWVGGSFSAKSSYWGKNGGGFFNGDDQCLAETSYSGVVVFACKLLASFFLSIRWLWRKIFRVSSRGENALSETEHQGLSKKGENGVNFHESRWEKARRKAEEKKQARLERELLEEEERKQREEVARLVEERRKLRDEKMGTDKERNKNIAADKEKENKKEAERKRHERRKEKDKGSSKSTSDGEEPERGTGRESERKRELDKRSENEKREFQKTMTESSRSPSLVNGHVIKHASNLSNGSAGTRYFDRVKGSLLSSSKAYGASFFGKSAQSPTIMPKAIKSSVLVDHGQALGNKREEQLSENIAGKLNFNGDNKMTDSIFHRPVEMQPHTPPKKSWQQLFTRSSTVTSSSNVNTISRPNQKIQAEVGSSHLSVQPSLSRPLDYPINFGVSSPFTLSSFSNGLASTISVSSATNSVFPFVGESAHKSIPEEPELFDGPCYAPDPVSLLGPVSESLDNFPLDLGTGFVTDTVELPHNLKSITTTSEINRPAPIESPLSRLRVAEEKHMNSNQFPQPPQNNDMLTSPMDEPGNTLGTWQMWGTSPLGQDGLNLVGGPASWLLPLGQNNSSHEDITHPAPQKAISSQFAKDKQIFPGTHSPQKVHLGRSQTDVITNSLVPGSNDSDPWLQKPIFQPLSGDGVNHFPPLGPQEDILGMTMTYGSPSRPATSHPSELPPPNCWSKREWAVHGSGEGVANSTQARPHIGGLFSTPDVQSLWSFNL